MLQNQDEESQSNHTNSLDMDKTNKTDIPKNINIIEQSKGKNSYNNLVNKIKLNYNLFHPKQRIQTIILHSNLDKSVNISDSSINDYLKYNDLSGINNDNLNTGFVIDNSIHHTTNNNRNTMNALNRAQMEQLVKGQEEEKNNQSAENKKNLINYNFTNDFIDKYKKNNNKNVKINLGNIFQGINNIPQKEKISISQNNYQDNQNFNNEETDEATSTNNEKFPYSSNTFKNNNLISQDLHNNIGKDFNKNYKNNINDLSTNMNSNSTKEDKNWQFGLNKNNNEKEVISSFNSGISNQNNYTFPYLRNSYSSLDNKLNENMNQSLNDNLGTKFTFKQQDNKINDNQYYLNHYERKSLPQNNPQNNIINNDINENDTNNIHDAHILTQGENNENKQSEILLHINPKEINNSNNKDNLENNNEEYIDYNNIDNNKQYINSNNLELTSDKKNDNFISNEKNNYTNINNNKNIDTYENNNITVTESEDNAIENKIYNRKKNNLLKSFLYGLLFGSTASGIFWLKNEGTRKYFLEKMKGINISSIFTFLKRFFSNPIKFFMKLFSHERMNDYIKVFGITFGNFVDIFEKYNDWFRFIGIVLCVYLIWILIKSFIRTFLKLWQENN